MYLIHLNWVLYLDDASLSEQMRIRWLMKQTIRCRRVLAYNREQYGNPLFYGPQYPKLCRNWGQRTYLDKLQRYKIISRAFHHKSDEWKTILQIVDDVKKDPAEDRSWS
jgi:hypothetical protein